MKSSMLRLVAAMLFLLPGLVGAAEMKQYFTGDYAMVSAEMVGNESDPGALLLKYGIFPWEHVAIEARYGVGLGEDTVEVNSNTVEYEIDSVYGVYLRGVIPGFSFDPYGIVGYTSADATATIPGFSSGSFSDDGVSFGIGADFFFADDVAINAEYLDATSGELETSMFNIGITWTF